MPPPFEPTRREVLRWLGAGAAALALPGCHSAAPTFFSSDERKMLAALADVVLPPDDQPGGSALGAVAYIEDLCTALEVSPPRFFAGGPSSNRSGGSSDDFANFLALDRVALQGARLLLYGSDGVAGGGPNDAVLGKIVGVRDQLKTGLASAIKLAGQPGDTLSSSQRNTVWNGLDPAFQNLLIDLVPQGAFGPPEYGGNPNLAGWKMIHFEGDVTPLGYSRWNAAANAYEESVTSPVSTANPGPDPEPMDSSTEALLQLVVAATGGRQAP